MIKVSAFIIIVIAAVCGLYSVALTTPDEDPFSEKNIPGVISSRKMASPTVAALKVLHAADHAPFALGVFGNSRMLMLSASAIGRAPEQVFNFALSSESLSGSVLLATRLQTMDRLPKTLIFGLDNLHLQRDNVPIWPPFWLRTTHAAKTVLSALADGAVVTAARRTWRFFWGETVRFDSIFGPTLVQAGAIRMIRDTQFTPAAPDTGGFRKDGSQAHTARARKTPPIDRTSSRLDLALFRQNLEALGAFAAAGHTVIVIETPIYPESQRRMNADVPDYVQASRAVWRDSCQAFRLHCTDAPQIEDTENNPWYDSTHPPAAPWATFVANTISKVTTGTSN